MNKFQQSLDYMESILLDEDVLRIFDSPNYPPLIKHHIKKMQELVYKATPKKVAKYRRHIKLEPTYFCPICENIVEKEQKYCTECGQALNWSDEDAK